MKAITRHSLIVGKGAAAHPLDPGTEIDTKSVGIDDVEARVLLAAGAIEKVKAPAKEAAAPEEGK